MSAHIEIRQLQCFVAVAEELSFRRAAERLCMTQPPLSRQIQALEASLGLSLFGRDRRGVSLTEAGAALLKDAQALLRQSEDMVRRARQRAQPASELNVGVTTVVDSGPFARVRPRFAADFPHVRLNFKRQISLRSIRDVERGLLDVAVIGLPSDTGDLLVERLGEDPLVAAMPSGHRLARRRRISILELGDDKLFWFARSLNPAFFDHCQRMFRRLGFDPERLPEPADHHVLLALIAAGDGVALVPASLRSIRRKGVIYREIRENAMLRIGIAMVRRAGECSELVEAFRDRVKRAFSGGEPESGRLPESDSSPVRPGPVLHGRPA